VSTTRVLGRFVETPMPPARPKVIEVINQHMPVG